MNTIETVVRQAIANRTVYTRNQMSTMAAGSSMRSCLHDMQGQRG